MQTGKRPLKVAFIGAGKVNFGLDLLPWNHSERLEKIGGVQIVAIVDPLIDKANDILTEKQNSPHSDLYTTCKVFENVPDLLSSPLGKSLDAVLIGVMPLHRGSFENGRDIELMCVKAGVNCFIEKPLALYKPLEFRSYFDAVREEIERKELVVSVGYMFRYHRAVTKMKELIQQHGGKVMAFNARYYYAYSLSTGHVWWNRDQAGGTIVEQGTHFCDLARYLAGEIDTESIQTLQLSAEDPSRAGELSKLNPDFENELTPSQCLPRVTSTHWRFNAGGIGSLMHVIALHGKRYESHIDVLMDGLRMTLYEPYHPECRLLIRDSQSDEEYVLEYKDDDPYETELRTFLGAVRSKDRSEIKSSYQDAWNTYEFTCEVQQKGTQNQ